MVTKKKKNQFIIIIEYDINKNTSNKKKLYIYFLCHIKTKHLNLGILYIIEYELLDYPFPCPNK